MARQCGNSRRENDNWGAWKTPEFEIQAQAGEVSLLKVQWWCTAFIRINTSINQAVPMVRISEFSELRPQTRSPSFYKL